MKRPVIEDFEALRFGYEESLLRRITERAGPIPLRDFSDAQRLLNGRRQDLLGDAVRITADLLPQVYTAYSFCLDLFRGAYSGDLFVRQSPTYNASVFAHEGKFDLLIHSGLLNDFTIDELRFVIGHELGHVAFEHSRFPIHEILSHLREIPPEIASLLLSWSRAAEVSADRIGLLCCGGLTPAVTALFKTASGLRGIHVDRILDSFRGQYEELERGIRKGRDAYRWMRTHPMIPIRFKALEMAALDIVALCRGAPGFSWKGFRAIDAQIAFILESLDR